MEDEPIRILNLKYDFEEQNNHFTSIIVHICCQFTGKDELFLKGL